MPHPDQILLFHIRGMRFCLPAPAVIAIRRDAAARSILGRPVLDHGGEILPLADLAGKGPQAPILVVDTGLQRAAYRVDGVPGLRTAPADAWQGRPAGLPGDIFLAVYHDAETFWLLCRPERLDALGEGGDWEAALSALFAPAGSDDPPEPGPEPAESVPPGGDPKSSGRPSTLPPAAPDAASVSPQAPEATPSRPMRRDFAASDKKRTERSPRPRPESALRERRTPVRPAAPTPPGIPDGDRSTTSGMPTRNRATRGDPTPIPPVYTPSGPSPVPGTSPDRLGQWLGASLVLLLLCAAGIYGYFFWLPNGGGGTHTTEEPASPVRIAGAPRVPERPASETSRPVPPARLSASRAADAPPEASASAAPAESPPGPPVLTREGRRVTLILNAPEPLPLAPAEGSREASPTHEANAPPGGGREFTHIVVRGDTLWDIAKKYLHDPFRYPELAELSRIRDPDLIYPGDEVHIVIRPRETP